VNDKTAATTANFIEQVKARCPFRIQTILTDNGKEFTDRFTSNGEREPTGAHRFDQTCRRHEIEHRLIRPKHPQTNGMVERFNGRISNILKTTYFQNWG
jgi:transposase InsO family protein